MKSDVFKTIDEKLELNEYEEIFENAVLSGNLPLIKKLLEIKKFDPTFKDNRMLFLAAKQDYESLLPESYRYTFVNKIVKLLINVDSIRKKLILEGARNTSDISDFHISPNLYIELRKLAFTIQIELINQEIQEKLKRMIKIAKELGEEENGEPVIMLDPNDIMVDGHDMILVSTTWPLTCNPNHPSKTNAFLWEIAKMHLRGEELPGVPSDSELSSLECLCDKKKDPTAKEELDLPEIVSEKPSYTPSSSSSRKRERDEGVAESASQDSKRRRVEEEDVTEERSDDEDTTYSFCRIA